MENSPQEQVSLTQEMLLHRIANRIRQSLELQEILLATVAEVRSFLSTDRVKIYQFQPDGHGLVIAESIQEGRLPPLLGLNFPADDIPPYARELFIRARQRSIVDLTTHEIGISPLDCPETGEALDQQDIRYRPVDPCHVEYLTAMGVRSSVVVPIVLQSKETGKDSLPSVRQPSQLWGLLVSHHSEPRVVTEQELQFIQSVVDQVAIAISQSILLNQVRAQARLDAIINQVTQQLYTTPTVQLQAALKETVAGFEGSGGRLYLLPEGEQSAEIYTCGVQPSLLDLGLGRPIEEHRLWQKYLYSATIPSSENSEWSVNWMRAVYALTQPAEELSSELNLWAVSDIYKEPLFRSIAPSFQATPIRGLLIVQLLYGSTVVGCLSIFRNEVDIETIWAGCVDSDSRQLMPRQSFEAWRELRTGQAQQWAESEVKLAQALGERFSTAIKQYRYQQVQALNTNLAQQVRDRTAELQQTNIELQRSIERQQAGARIIAKIRQSLDVETIFKTTTQEVCQLLNRDRVAVYRFNADWGGEFVSDYEFANPRWQRNVKLGVGVVWDDTHLQDTQGGRYRNHETFVVDDVYSMGFTQCHLDMLEQFHVKAFMIAPIFVGQELWGLLGAYQHSGTHHWEAMDVEFFTQIATQLGVALQQAEYLEQVRSQSVELARVAERQQTLAGIIAKMRQSLDVETIFRTTTQEVCQLLNSDRLAVYRFNADSGGEFVSDYESANPRWQKNVKFGVGVVWDDTLLQDTQGGRYRNHETFVVDDVYSMGFTQCHLDILEQFHVKAYMMAPIFVGQELWGLLGAYQHSSRRHWEASEGEFFTQIATQLGVALQQAEYLEQLRLQTKQLAHVAERQQTLASVITKVRESLDLNEIFETTTLELRRVLNADRVVVFRFYSESNYDGGEVIAEDVAPSFPSTLEAKVSDHCLSEYTDKISHRYIHAVTDIYNADLNDCYVSMLSRFQIRANLVIPMIKQGKLWGLLCIHQCQKPREWQESEIEFLRQIASQLGVALQHAVLLKHTQQQATQLSQALHHLRETQAHLIQSEKMSSLGQLVAGVAHEINNPVNFIYGNLSHIDEYTHDLIEILNLYQHHYPVPAPEIQQRAKVADLEFIAEDLPKLFSSLQVGAERIREIVLCLRNFSRLDQAEVKSVDIHEGLDSTLLILQHRLKPNSLHSGIQVHKQYGDLPLVECFAGQLNQVFMNLLANAADALEESIRLSPVAGGKKHHPTIAIRTQLVGGDRVQISIKDNGVGMTQEVQAKLFDPFFTTKPVGQGTGLGLSISYQIVEKHKGKFQCVSQPGEGAEFLIDIPVKQSGAKVARLSQAAM